LFVLRDLIFEGGGVPEREKKVTGGKSRWRIKPTRMQYSGGGLNGRDSVGEKGPRGRVKPPRSAMKSKVQRSGPKPKSREKKRRQEKGLDLEEKRAGKTPWPPKRGRRDSELEGERNQLAGLEAGEVKNPAEKKNQRARQIRLLKRGRTKTPAWYHQNKTKKEGEKKGHPEKEGLPGRLEKKRRRKRDARGKTPALIGGDGGCGGVGGLR